MRWVIAYTIFFALAAWCAFEVFYGIYASWGQANDWDRPYELAASVGAFWLYTWRMR